MIDDFGAEEASSPLEKLLPRIYELKTALTDPGHQDAYFQHFETNLSESSTARADFQRVEQWLDALDERAWENLKSRAVQQLISKTDRRNGRGWQSLFDVLSEARAFLYLTSIGCRSLEFINRSDTKTPDISGLLHSAQLFCEVKTINISEERAGVNRQIAQEGIARVRTTAVLAPEFLVKLRDTLTKALNQLDAVDPGRAAHRLIFAMLHFDDWLGEYQREYIAQIDGDLLRAPTRGADLVVCLFRNPFNYTYSMMGATVLAE